MRDIRKCWTGCRTKTLAQYHPPCVQLKLLNEALLESSSSTTVPFSELKIDLIHTYRYRGASVTAFSHCEEHMDVDCSKIIKVIPLRNLVVTHGDSVYVNAKIPSACPVIPFLRRLISLQDEWLEEIELVGIPAAVCRQLLKMGKLRMRELKTLKVSFARNCGPSLKKLYWLRFVRMHRS